MNRRETAKHRLPQYLPVVEEYDAEFHADAKARGAPQRKRLSRFPLSLCGNVWPRALLAVLVLVLIATVLLPWTISSAAVRQDAGATPEEMHLSDIKAPVAPWDFHNKYELEMRNHRVNPIGMQYYAPWASGKTLRAQAELRESLAGTLVFYGIARSDPVAVENLKFYLRMVEMQLRRKEGSGIADGEVEKMKYRDVFVVAPSASMAEKEPELWANLGRLASTPWAQHVFEVVTLNENQGYCGADVLRMIDCAIPQLTFDYGTYRSVVLLDNTVAGPLLPKYWVASGYEFWSDVYADRLSDSVWLVGPRLSCSAGGGLPVFEDPPVAMHQSLFQIFWAEGLKHSLMDLTRLLFASGSNLQALHEQPAGMDWQRWRRQANPPDCPVLLRRPPSSTESQSPCKWQDWKARYPELSMYPLFVAREYFMSRSAPQGDCDDVCNYGKYMSYYSDLKGLKSIEDAREHFLLHGSIDGRICFEESEMLYRPHAYETLFMRRDSPQASPEVDKYMEWAPRIQASLSAAGPGRARQPEERVLVVYAYFEKDDKHRENMLYFLETCVEADARQGYRSNVDYIVLVSGASSVKFPALQNLRVIPREDTCFESGGWMTGLQHREPVHKFFFCISSSFRGPTLPSWYKEHWTSAMLAPMSGRTQLVGTAIKCPDASGRPIPHVPSTAVAFNAKALELGAQSGVFNCEETENDALKDESSWALKILENGANIATMQAMFTETDWTGWYNEHRASSPVRAVMGPNGMRGCDEVSTEVYMKNGWYGGMSPHPMEYVFHPADALIGDGDSRAIGHVREASIAGEAATKYSAVGVAPVGAPLTLRIALFSHSLDMDGAPRLLYQMALDMKRRGHQLTVLCPFRGALQALYEAAEIPVIILQVTGKNFWDALDSGHDGLEGLLRRHFTLLTMPDLVVLNTIMWADYVYAMHDVRPERPRIAWVLHEGEIAEKSVTPSGWWFGKKFQQLASERGLRRLTASVSSVVFVADATRALWSRADLGNFYTFHGYVSRSETEARASIFGNEAAVRALRTQVGAEGKYMLTAVGTICQRKQQSVLVKALELVGGEIFGKDGYVLVLVGAPSDAGGSGDRKYYNGLVEYVKGAKLEEHVKFVPFADDALKYVAAADLHFSASMNEAFPLNTLEAMLLQTPVMMTRAGGSEEQLADPRAEGDGFLLPVTPDEKVMARKIKAHLKGRDLKSVLPAMGTRARQTVLRRFTDEVAGDRMDKLLAEVMGTSPVDAPQGRVCIIVRTFAGQLQDPIYNLEKMLKSLVAMNYKAWNALVVQTDPAEMEGLYGLLSRLDDHRLRVIQYPDLHAYKSGAFEITDKVISQCPPSSDWLLATNGDNTYEPEFLDHLDLDYDIVAYDFYSRSTHLLDPEIQGEGCAKYFEHRDSLCKENLLKHWHTDLGSNVINLRRWILEGRSFEALNEEDGSADGHTMESLVYFNWRAKHVHVQGKCLFSHNPNLVSCAEADSRTIWLDGAHQCVIDDARKQQLTKEGYHPYLAARPHAGVVDLQGRCFDNICPRHGEFIAIASGKTEAAEYFYVDGINHALHRVKEPERANCRGRNAAQSSRRLPLIPKRCGDYTTSSKNFAEQRNCGEELFGI